MTDLRYTLRALKKTPAFTALAIVVLAVGIGLNTAIFSVINAVLFSRPNVPAAGELRYVYVTPKDYGLWQDDFRKIRDNNDVFQGLASEAIDYAKLGTGGDAHLIRGAQESANYFDVLQ